MHAVPRWLVVLVISRDVVVVLGYFLLFMLTQRTMEVHPSVFGKLSTGLQILTVSLVLWTLPGLPAAPLGQGVFYVTAIITAVAGLQYMYRGLAWLQREGQVTPAAAPEATEEERHRRRGAG
jgi:cardiolipin synthase